MHVGSSFSICCASIAKPSMRRIVSFQERLNKTTGELILTDDDV